MRLLGLEALPLLFVSEFRDVVIIVWGILSVLLLLALLLLVAVLTLSVRRLISDVNRLLDTGVRPLLESARETAGNVTGTTRFVGDKVVTPIIRIVSIISGLRRGIAVFTGLSGRGKSREERA